MPPALALPSLRSMMRLKRTGEQFATSHPSVADTDVTENIRLQKMRRVEPGAEATTSYLTSPRRVE